jgi:hypothetical protein
VVGAVAIACVVFVLGLLVGGCIAPMIGEWFDMSKASRAAAVGRWLTKPRCSCDIPRADYVNGGALCRGKASMLRLAIRLVPVRRSIPPPTVAVRGAWCWRQVLSAILGNNSVTAVAYRTIPRARSL